MGPDAPLIPEEFRGLLSSYVTHQILLDKNDDRASSYLNKANTRYVSMVNENHRRSQNASKKHDLISYRKGKNTGRLQTSNGVYYGFGGSR